MSNHHNRSSRGYIDPNFPDPYGPNDADFIIYGYRPSLALSALGVSLFTISTLLHIFFLYRHRTYYFSIPLIIGSAFEQVGYVFRILSSVVDPYNIIYFVVQYFFIVVAPVLFSASIYAVLSVLITRLGAQYAPILRPKTIVIVFVACDVVCTAIQITGSALIGVAESKARNPSIAAHILLAGLCAQLFSFLVFIILFGVFIRKARNVIVGKVKIFVIALCVASFCIFLRTCFRTGEIGGGVFSYSNVHEAFFGCLEFAPVVVAVFAFVGFHPGRLLPRRVERSEIESESKK